MHIYWKENCYAANCVLTSLKLAYTHHIVTCNTYSRRAACTLFPHRHFETIKTEKSAPSSLITYFNHLYSIHIYFSVNKTTFIIYHLLLCLLVKFSFPFLLLYIPIVVIYNITFRYIISYIFEGKKSFWYADYIKYKYVHGMLGWNEIIKINLLLLPRDFFCVCVLAGNWHAGILILE